MYGDAPVTVSTSTLTSALPALSPPAGPAFRLGGTYGSKYVN